jgi:hypothetical protein
VTIPFLERKSLALANPLRGETEKEGYELGAAISQEWVGEDAWRATVFT